MMFPRPRTVPAVFCCGVFSAVAVPCANASEPSVRQYVAQANEALAQGHYAAAVEAYTKAQEGDPESPEIAYNFGVAAYKLGDMTKAKEQFSSALRTRDANLEARAKFNLGNIAYGQALAKQSAIPEAIQSLRTAVAHYRDALDVRADDPDARANIEMAWLLIKRLEEQQEQQEQQKEQKQSEQNDQHDKDEKQGQEDDEKGDKPQSQPASQPQSRSPADQDQQDRSEQDGEEQQNERREEAGQSPPQGTDQQDAAPLPAQAKPLSREEAERLLQSVRDRERERRLVLLARTKRKVVKTKKDW